jgi:HIV Tat-specific factor 1
MSTQKADKGDDPKEKPRANTSVYVSSLPTDTSADELRVLFSKYGVVAQDLLTTRHKVKLYQDEAGNFTGSALVTYLRPESVSLAIEMADGSQLRGSSIKVEEAVFKSTSEDSTKKRTLTEDEQKIITTRLKQLKDKVNNWDEDKVNAKWIRTVVLKKVFTLRELEEDPHAKRDIELDIEEGCSEIGKVEQVVLFDEEPEGVVLVRFTTEQEPDACIDKMNGRFFGGQKLTATKYDGEEFHRSAGKKPEREEQHGDLKRLDEYIKTVEE